MNVRAKFKVVELIERSYGHGHKQKSIVMTPEYDAKIAEDVSFSKATPSGKIEMQIDNPVAIEALEVGKYFYVDFTPVEVPVTV